MSTKNWTIVAAVSLGIALAIYGLATKAILYAVPYEFFKLYEMAVHIHILQSLGILILGVQSKSFNWTSYLCCLWIFLGLDENPGCGRRRIA